MAESTRPQANSSGPAETPRSSTVVGDNNSPLLSASIPGLVGRFRVGEELARGGVGVVYRAHDSSVGRDVAVKVLHDHLRGDERMVARFVAEARVTGQLQHPGVPPVFEVGNLPDGSPFLAMKLIKGFTLANLLGERPDPSADRGRFVAIFEQITQAVGYAHTHYVVHRDLKPHNVMVGAHGEVQVMDWGLAKVLTEGAPPVVPGPADGTFVTEIWSDRTDADSTRAGTVLGTPAFMAREQAVGAINQVDQRSDVFGLGAILCAILTGRSPYVAADSESARQMAAVADLDDAFTRLDGCGAEPGLVELCKRCLSPEKENRPADGTAVARAVADLRAAAEDRARRAEVERERAEVRAAEQRKRRRVQLLLALAVGLLMLGGGGFAWWRDRQRSAQVVDEERRKAAEFRAEVQAETARQSVRKLLDASVALRKRYRFADAAVALDEAERLTGEGAADLRREVEAARADLAFVRRLDDIRMMRSSWVAEPGGDGAFDVAGAVKEYPIAFRDHGLDVLGADPGAVAAAVAESPIKIELVAALDDWAALPLERATNARILSVLRQADPGPWQDAFRDPAVRRSRMALGVLARSADPAGLHHATITALAVVMQARGLNPRGLLLRAQLLHPGEFLIPFQLGQWHLDRKEYDAVAHYRAARVARPEHLTALNNLGVALDRKGEHAAAAAAYREAIRLDPRYARAHYNLGLALFDTGDFGGAAAAFREAIRLDPRYARAHNNLGNALRGTVNKDGAVAAYREAIRLDPEFVLAHNNLGVALHDKNDLIGAEAALREAIRLDPLHAAAHSNLGNVLRDKRDLDGAVAAYREAIRLDPRLAKTHYSLGIALYMRRDVREAVTAFREAIHLDPIFTEAHTNLGVMLMLTGDVDGAMAAHREAIRINPRFALAHSNLGIVLDKKGDCDGAVAAFREAVRLDPKNRRFTQYLDDALKRQAERDARTAPPPRLVDR